MHDGRGGVCISVRVTMISLLDEEEGKSGRGVRIYGKLLSTFSFC